MITFMLCFQWFVTPVITATSVKTWYWAMVLCFVVSLSFWSINYIAVELEQPFGDDANDLPLLDMQQDLNKSLRQLLHERCKKQPEFDFRREQHEKLTLVAFDFD